MFILVCLLLGMVTTVAVAWGIALRVSPAAITSMRHFRRSFDAAEGQAAQGKMAGLIMEESQGPGTAHWSVRPLPNGFVKFRFLWENERPIEAAPRVPRLRKALEQPAQESDPNRRMLIQGRGWPVIALWCEIRRDPTTEIDGTTVGDGGFNTPRQSWNDVSYGSVMPPAKVIPIFPVLPGFVIDSAFYGSFWCVAALICDLVRRRRRSAAGCCISCGYDMTGNTTGRCPECGAATVMKAV